MRILITGGAGYIGYSLVDALESLPEIKEITVFDNLYRNNTHFFSEGKKLHKTRFVKGDILNMYDLEKVVHHQDVVVHLAGYVEFPYSYQDNYRFEQVNHYGTVVLFNMLEKYPVSKIINLSSAAVYGFAEHVGESTPAAPANFYGASKLNAEQYLNVLADRSMIYQLRSANVFGYNPMVRLDSVINRFIFDALIYDKIKIHGSGNQFRPFISLSTIVDQIGNFIIEDKTSGIYNLVEFNLSMNELRDFLMSRNADLEFTYLNSNQEFKTLSMISEKVNLMIDPEVSLNKAYDNFKENIRL